MYTRYGTTAQVPDGTRKAGASLMGSRASVNPSINAWYAATLWVAGPIVFEI